MSDTMTTDATAAPGGNGETKTPPLFLPVRHVVRLAVEAVTPLSPSSGEADADVDAPLFRDWNGLPCLYGAAVAGVIRSVYQDYFGEDERDDLFGFEESRKQTGAASRLMVSFGLVHGADDKPVDGYLKPGAIGADNVLALLHSDAPLIRDHVAIDENGVAAANKLFDRVSCPKGARFTLELCLDGEKNEAAKGKDGETLLNAVRMIEAPYARFGAAGRRGLGRVKIVRDGEGPRAFYAAIDRTGSEGRDRWESYRQAGFDDSLPQGLFRRLNERELAPAGLSVRGPVVGELRLEAKGFWRLGQGSESWLGDRADAEKAADVVPPVEAALDWSSGVGRVTKEFMAPVPGSGVKGAIAHRTEFHLRRIMDVWADDDAGGEVAATPPETTNQSGRLSDSLFGSGRQEKTGFAGAFFLDDVYVDFGPVAEDERAGRRTRNSIDRHTGGVRLGPLFTDEVLWRGPELVIPFVLLARVPDLRRKDDSREESRSPLMPTPEEAVKALAWALEDLCEERLAIGAREGAGDGVFEGSVTGPGGRKLDLIDESAKAAKAAEDRETDIRLAEAEKRQTEAAGKETTDATETAGRKAA